MREGRKNSPENSRNQRKKPRKKNLEAEQKQQKKLNKTKQMNPNRNKTKTAHKIAQKNRYKQLKTNKIQIPAADGGGQIKRGGRNGGKAAKK